MNWDTSIPANVGYIAGLLYNQNNIASESSPATSLMEREVQSATVPSGHCTQRCSLILAVSTVLR